MNEPNKDDAPATQKGHASPRALMASVSAAAADLDASAVMLLAAHLAIDLGTAKAFTLTPGDVLGYVRDLRAHRPIVWAAIRNGNHLGLVKALEIYGSAHAPALEYQTRAAQFASFRSPAEG